MSRGAVALSETGLTRSDVGGLAAADVRPDAGGTPVLCVPGYTGSKEDFGALLGLLAPFRAVAVDLPGQFESPRLPDYTWDAFTGAVLEAVVALGGRAHVVGHSFGGLVCQRAAIARPEAFASLVLLDSGPSGLGGRRRQDILALRSVVPAMSPEVLYDQLVAGGFATAEGIARTRWVATDPHQLVQAGHLVTEADDVVAQLATTGVPVRVVSGELDDAWPVPVQQEMAHRLGTEAVLVAGAAHSPAVEQPERLAEVLLAAW